MFLGIRDGIWQFQLWSGCGAVVLGDKWKPLVLFHLTKGDLRYGALRRPVGSVSYKVLIQHLKEMVADGIIARHDHREVPPRVDHCVTPFGRGLADALFPLCRWGEEFAQEIETLKAKRSLVPELVA